METVVWHPLTTLKSVMSRRVPSWLRLNALATIVIPLLNAQNSCVRSVVECISDPSVYGSLSSTKEQANILIE